MKITLIVFPFKNEGLLVLIKNEIKKIMLLKLEKEIFLFL